MTPDEEGFTAEDLIEAQCPLDISAMNGIALLATVMRTHGLLTDGQLATLHTEMSNPLGTADLAENAVVQTAQGHLDRLFAAIAQV